MIGGAVGCSLWTYPPLASALGGKRCSPDSAVAWAEADAIRRRVVVPEFPDFEVDIRDFGAVADGKTDCSNAMRLAVERVSEAGGGRVRISPGHYRTGPIHLRSNINLHIDRDARVSFFPDPERYLPAVFTRWEGMELMGYSPLIYAYQQRNVAITGAGVLDGGADRNTWWPWKGWREDATWAINPPAKTQAVARDRLQLDMEKGVPPQQRYYAEGAYLRPPFIQMYGCENVLIEGVTITDAPFWLIHPVLCESVTVRKVSCRSHGPNSDGCNPESCSNVVIEDCYFDTGDDCIALKSGRNADGRRLNRPCENVVISNCKMSDGHGGVVIGSEISGGARNIFVENCIMSSPNLEKGIRIKTNSVRGGVIENVRIRNVKIGEVQDAIVINFYYEEGDRGQFDPLVRDIEIRDLVCSQAERVFHVRGFDRAPIRNLRICNTTFMAAEQIGVIEHVEDLTIEAVNVNGRPLEL